MTSPISVKIIYSNFVHSDGYEFRRINYRDNSFPAQFWDAWRKLFTRDYSRRQKLSTQIPDLHTIHPKSEDLRHIETCDLSLCLDFLNMPNYGSREALPSLEKLINRVGVPRFKTGLPFANQCGELPNITAEEMLLSICETKERYEDLILSRTLPSGPRGRCRVALDWTAGGGMEILSSTLDEYVYLNLLQAEFEGRQFRRCGVCGAFMTAERRSKKFCRPACRAKASRQ